MNLEILPYCEFHYLGLRIMFSCRFNISFNFKFIILLFSIIALLWTLIFTRFLHSLLLALSKLYCIIFSEIDDKLVFHHFDDLLFVLLVNSIVTEPLKHRAVVNSVDESGIDLPRQVLNIKRDKVLELESQISGEEDCYLLHFW